MISASEVMGITHAHVTRFDDTEHSLHPTTIKALHKMQTAAAKDDVDIQVCSSFRSFDKQLSIWNRKWQGDLPLNTLDGQQLNAAQLSDEEKIHAIMLWSALPGASRHHWGTDFDIYDKTQVAKQHHTFELVPEEYTGSGPCAAMSTWVKEHAASYGFSLPYAKYCGGVAQEPWHLSYQVLANDIETHLNIDALHETLSKADILGKEQILARLTALVNRYTFNNGRGEYRAN
jgi:LAS superfamily LD-carboxypeptidase LdcB